MVRRLGGYTCRRDGGPGVPPQMMAWWVSLNARIGPGIGPQLGRCFSPGTCCALKAQETPSHRLAAPFLPADGHLTPTQLNLCRKPKLVNEVAELDSTVRDFNSCLFPQPTYKRLTGLDRIGHYIRLDLRGKADQTQWQRR